MQVLNNNQITSIMTDSSRLEQPRFVFPSVQTSTPAMSSTSIINVDMSSSSEASAEQSPNTTAEEAANLNTATLHDNFPLSPGSPTYTTAKSLLAPVSTASLDPSYSDSGQQLVSLLKQAGIPVTPNLQHFYNHPQLALVNHLSQQSSIANELGRRLYQTLEMCQSCETEAGMEERRKIVQELDTLLKQWIRSEGLKQGMGWNYVEQVGGKVVTVDRKSVV